MYPQPQAKLAKTNPLSRKLTAILNSSLDDQATIESLEILSVFYSNSPANRRNLRSTLEKRAMGLNTKFLEHFEDVKKVGRLSRSCEF
jgi:hypothetical protein